MLRFSFLKKSSFLLILFLFFFSLIKISWAVTQTQLNTSQSHIVSIKARAVVAAYGAEGMIYGTGCIIDKKNGILLTNAHIASTNRVVPYYEITLHNGRELIARLLYQDPWHDFSFLKVDPKDLSDLPAELSIETKELKTGEFVYIIGKNENKHFSTQTGTVANYYEATSLLPGQVFRISLNAQGGASGSPVFNQSGKVVGLIHASNGLTSAFALPIAYAMDALKLIQQGKTPSRKGTGILLGYTSLDDLVRFYRFPKEIADHYRSKFPESFNRILFVKSILAGTPATSSFQAGDVLTHINNQEIGPDLYKADKIINDLTLNNSNDEIEFKIIRLGNSLTIKVTAYDLQKHKIQKILQFGGALFYETDDTIIQRTGVKQQRVFITNVRPGSSFFESIPMLPRAASTLVCVTNIEGKEINTLQDVIDLIPTLIEKEDFYIFLKNYGVELGFDELPFFAQTPQITHLSYSRHDGLPEIYQFDHETNSWNVHIVSPKEEKQTQ